MSLRTMLVDLYSLVAACCLFLSIVETRAPGVHLEDYLQKFGYLTQSTGGAAQQAQDVSKSLKHLQKFAGIEQTGVLDEETIKLIKTPRCGDKDPNVYDRRRRRYVLEGSKWKKKNLTYRIMNDPYDGPTSEEHMPRELISRAIKAAFQKWTYVANLKFREIHDGEPDIRIQFIRGKHGDGYNFDGQGGSLAHAFYPHTNEGLSGDVHFDLDEKFTLTELGSTNFIWVTTHEFGHSLGLQHNNIKGTIMYPWLTKGRLGDVHLQDDDIKGIQYLYGKPTWTRREPKIILPSPPRPECKQGFDATFTGKHGKHVYGIIDRKFYKLTRSRYDEQPQWGKPVKDHWPGLKLRVKAAYTRNDGRTVFFTKYRYYIYDGTRKLEGPNFIEEYGLPSDLREIDAAFVFARNGDTYFFKGNQYWRFNERERRVYEGYPKSITTYWQGLPDSIDAVLQTPDEETVFFKGGQYYKVKHSAMSVLPTFPKPIGPDWLGCDEDQSEPNILARGDHSSSHKLRVSSSLVTFMVLVTLLMKLF